MTIGEVLDATNARWFRWHHERTPIVCPPLPCSPPWSCRGGPARSLCGAGNRPRPLTREVSGAGWVRGERPGRDG